MNSTVSPILIPGISKLTEDRVLKILKAVQRSEEDTLFLYHNIQKLSFFEAFFTTEDGEVVKEWCLKCLQSMRFETFKAGEVVLLQGTPSNGKAYIIYSGEVSVIVKDRDPMSQKNLNSDESSSKKNSSFFKGKSSSRVNIDSKTNIDEAEDDHEEDQPRPEYGLLKKGKSKQFVIQEEPKMDETVTRFKKALVTGLFSPDIARKPILKKEKTVKELTSNEKEVIKVSVTRMKSSLKGNKLLKKLTTSVNDTIENISKQYGTVKDTIKEGGYFGERALIEDSKRSATILANTNLILLSVNKDDIEFVKFKFDAQKYKVFDILCQAFPELDGVSSSDIKESYVYLTEDRTYPANSIIFDESDPGTKLYFLYQGTCEIYRNIWVDESDDMKGPLKDLKRFYKFTPIKTRKITIAQVSAGTILGEDILFKKNSSYHYSVRVISETAKLLSITKGNFLLRFPFQFKDDLKDLYQMRTINYCKIVQKEANRRNIVIHNDDLTEHLLGHLSVNDGKKLTSLPKSVNPYTGMLVDSPKAELEVISEVPFSKSTQNKTTHVTQTLKNKLAHFSRKDFIVPDPKAKVRRSNPYNPNELSSPVIRSDNLSTSITYESAMDKYIDMSKIRNHGVGDHSFRIPHIDTDDDGHRKYKSSNKTNQSVQLPYLDLENSLSSNRSFNLSKIKNHPRLIRLGSLSKDSIIDNISFITNPSDIFTQPNSPKHFIEPIDPSGFSLRSLVPSKGTPKVEPILPNSARDPLVEKYIKESLFGKNVKKRRRMVPPLLSKTEQMKKLKIAENKTKNSVTLFESLCL